MDSVPIYDRRYGIADQTCAARPSHRIPHLSRGLRTACRETLGESDGKAGQVFKTRFAPVHPLDPGEVILTAALGEELDSPNWLEWQRMETFADSGPDDRHFGCDELTGEISFGPQIERPDGGPPDRHGAVPDKGHQVVLTAYRVGGGTAGNVREGRICVDKGSIQFIAEVENPRPARNGRDMESMEHAAMKATKILKTRNRAVTKEDYELIALEQHGVGRACCLQPLHPYAYTGIDVPAGTVELLVVPALGEMAVPRIQDLVVPTEVLQRVKAHLDERRLLTATLEVKEAKYVFVETEITLIPDPRLDPDMVAVRVRDRLNAFLHPITGGPNKTGWPFGRPLTLTDIYVQLSEKLGVALLREVKIVAYRVGHPTKGRFGEEQAVDPVKGLEINPDEVICTRRHNIRLLPISAQRLHANGAAKL
jgi:predicted phage baseplate assembly protein